MLDTQKSKQVKSSKTEYYILDYKVGKKLPKTKQRNLKQLSSPSCLKTFLSHVSGEDRGDLRVVQNPEF